MREKNLDRETINRDVGRGDPRVTFGPNTCRRREEGNEAGGGGLGPVARRVRLGVGRIRYQRWARPLPGPPFLPPPARPFFPQAPPIPLAHRPPLPRFPSPALTTRFCPISPSSLSSRQEAPPLPSPPPSSPCGAESPDTRTAGLRS